MPSPSKVLIQTPEDPSYGILNVTVHHLSNHTVTVTAKGAYHTYKSTISRDGLVNFAKNNQVMVDNYVVSVTPYEVDDTYYLGTGASPTVTVVQGKSATDTITYQAAKNGLLSITNTQKQPSNLEFVSTTTDLEMQKKNVSGEIQIPVGTYTVSATRSSDNAVEGFFPNVVTIVAHRTATAETTKPSYVLAPYIDFTVSHWDSKSGKMVPSINLHDTSDKAGVKRFTLAFITSAGSCKPAWAGTPTLATTGTNAWGLKEVNQFEATGGQVIISFGGENGTMLASNCNQQQLVSNYQNIIDTYHPMGIDFDIEGGNINAAATNEAAYIQALKVIKQANPELLISFTVPVLPTGLKSNPALIRLLQYAAKENLDYSRLNLMTMDFGPYSAPNAQAMGTYTIDSAKSVYSFLKTIYGGKKSNVQLWSMIGLTPMIGVNDTAPEVFKISAAKQVVRFAANMKLGAIRFWSLNRDTPCSHTWASPICSGGIKNTESGVVSPVENKAYEYAQLFQKPLNG